MWLKTRKKSQISAAGDEEKRAGEGHAREVGTSKEGLIQRFRAHARTGLLEHSFCGLARWRMSEALLLPGSEVRGGTYDRLDGRWVRAVVSQAGKAGSASLACELTILVSNMLIPPAMRATRFQRLEKVATLLDITHRLRTLDVKIVGGRHRLDAVRRCIAKLEGRGVNGQMELDSIWRGLQHWIVALYNGERYASQDEVARDAMSSLKTNVGVNRARATDQEKLQGGLFIARTQEEIVFEVGPVHARKLAPGTEGRRFFQLIIQLPGMVDDGFGLLKRYPDDPFNECYTTLSRSVENWLHVLEPGVGSGDESVLSRVHPQLFDEMLAAATEEIYAATLQPFYRSGASEISTALGSKRFVQSLEAYRSSVGFVLRRHWRQHPLEAECDVALRSLEEDHGGRSWAHAVPLWCRAFEEDIIESSKGEPLMFDTLLDRAHDGEIMGSVEFGNRTMAPGQHATHGEGEYRPTALKAGAKMTDVDEVRGSVDGRPLVLGRAGLEPPCAETAQTSPKPAANGRANHGGHGRAFRSTSRCVHPVSRADWEGELSAVEEESSKILVPNSSDAETTGNRRASPGGIDADDDRKVCGILSTRPGERDAPIRGRWKGFGQHKVDSDRDGQLVGRVAGLRPLFEACVLRQVMCGGWSRSYGVDLPRWETPGAVGLPEGISWEDVLGHNQPFEYAVEIFKRFLWELGEQGWEATPAVVRGCFRRALESGLSKVVGGYMEVEPPGRPPAEVLLWLLGEDAGLGLRWSAARAMPWTMFLPKVHYPGEEGYGDRAENAEPWLFLVWALVHFNGHAANNRSDVVEVDLSRDGLHRLIALEYRLQEEIAGVDDSQVVSADSSDWVLGHVFAIQREGRRKRGPSTRGYGQLPLAWTGDMSTEREIYGTYVAPADLLHTFELMEADQQSLWEKDSKSAGSQNVRLMWIEHAEKQRQGRRDRIREWQEWHQSRAALSGHNLYNGLNAQGGRPGVDVGGVELQEGVDGTASLGEH